MSANDLTVSDVATRSGFSASALRFYERKGLISAERTAGNQRRFARAVLRRLAFIGAARHVGLTLDEIAEELDRLPGSRTPTAEDWAAISTSWRGRLEEEIAALQKLRDSLTSCIGCGCLSLERCAISNPGDVEAAHGSGAAFWPRPLHPQE